MDLTGSGRVSGLLPAIRPVLLLQEHGQIVGPSTANADGSLHGTAPSLPKMALGTQYGSKIAAPADAVRAVNCRRGMGCLLLIMADLVGFYGCR